MTAGTAIVRRAHLGEPCRLPSAAPTCPKSMPRPKSAWKGGSKTESAEPEALVPRLADDLAGLQAEVPERERGRR